jgi:hypothetical protein
MQKIIRFGAVLSVLALTTATVAGVVMKKSAVVRFMKPIVIAGAIVEGTVIVEHDDARMARGEPCTTVFEADPVTHAKRRVAVEFMCVPVERAVAKTFQATCKRLFTAAPERLVEYQFAGETEGHGVPLYR